MFNPNFAKAVEDFSSLLLPVSEKDLERHWEWKSHKGEGIRFAFFVTIQQLRQLAVSLATKRKPLTQAQHILGQYHRQYMDLQAAVFGLSAEDVNCAPAEGEWSVRQAYGHMLSADIYFSAIVRYALESHRAGTWKPERPSDEDELRLIRMTEEEFDMLTKDGPFEKMLAYHRKFHPEIVQEFSRITDEELDLPSVMWEDIHFPIRHRLHRYEAHLIQHTVQVDKTLTAIGQSPSETKRLIRHVFAALSEVEANLIGADNLEEECLPLAKEINARATEIREILSSG
jgi:hypothetical protein